MADVAFGIAFSGYAIWSLLVIASGAFAIVAGQSPGLHARLHELALSEGLMGRVSDAIATVSHRPQPAIQLIVDYAFALFSFVLAGVLLWLRPHDRAARLLVVGLVGTAALFNIQANTVYETMRATPGDELLKFMFQMIAGLSYVYALLLFPDGWLIPRWRGWLLAAIYLPVTVGITTLSYVLQGPTHRLFQVLFFGLLAPVAGLLSQAYRYRRSFILIEQQQARLLFWALTPALAVASFVVFLGVREAMFPGFVGRPVTQLPVGIFRLFTGVFAIIPAALFLGMVRFRLWDIDRIVNRTLVYGVIIGIIALTYWGGVVTLQRLFSRFTRENDVAVAISTLLVAAMFQPLRERVRNFIDKRFYRTHYDMAKEIDTFSAELRHEVDLTTLEERLHRVMGHTVQPVHMSFWLRDERESVNGR